MWNVLIIRFYVLHVGECKLSSRWLMRKPMRKYGHLYRCCILLEGCRGMILYAFSSCWNQKLFVFYSSTIFEELSCNHFHFCEVWLSEIYECISCIISTWCTLVFWKIRNKNICGFFRDNLQQEWKMRNNWNKVQIGSK
jgi:hypothetical protein